MSPVVHRGNPDVLRRAPHGGDHVPRAGAALAALGVARPRARRPAAVHRTRCARRGGREPDAGRIVVADGRCPRSGPERLEASCGEAVRGVHERAADPGPGCAVVIADAGHRCGLEVDEADRTRHQAPDRIDVGRRIRRPTLRHESTDGTASTRSRIRVGRRRSRIEVSPSSEPWDRRLLTPVGRCQDCRCPGEPTTVGPPTRMAASRSRPIPTTGVPSRCRILPAHMAPLMATTIWTSANRRRLSRSRLPMSDRTRLDPSDRSIDMSCRRTRDRLRQHHLDPLRADR